MSSSRKTIKNNSLNFLLNENIDDKSDSDDEDFVVNEESSYESDDESKSSDSNENDLSSKEDDEEAVTPKPVTNAQSKERFKNIPLCCICLHKSSDEGNELVECDNCGIFVHEGCYGICDSDSKVSSQDSSELTEPWFCNACLLNVKNPECDLCPNRFGIFKETEAGRLVHMLCALYTPYVAYHDIDRLWPVVLDEIPSSKWGDKICNLCEDSRLARTGICIKCDAGLCKSYFHVTCAQKHGLLIDPLQADTNLQAIEPYLAYCKQHNDTVQINQRKRAYEKLTAFYDEKKQLTKNDQRLQRKFQKACDAYDEKKRSRARPMLPKYKIPRPITTCPSALINLLKKAELMGINQNEISNEQQKIKPGVVSFSTDFITYYFDREKKIAELHDQIKHFYKEEDNLKEQENKLRKKLEERTKEIDSVLNHNNELKTILYQFISLIEKNSDNDLTKIKKNIEKSIIISDIEENNTNTAKNLIQLKTCLTCNTTKDQYLLINCDTCKNNYHINCLDPPLETVPIKTKNYGWECVSCIEKAFKDGNDVNPNEPRKLRIIRNPSEKLKSTSMKNELNKSHQFELMSNASTTTNSKKSATKSTKKVPKKRVNSEPSTSVENKKKRSSVPTTPAKSIESIICKICSKKTNKKDSIKCCECNLTYHGECNEPPIDIKRFRGYAWTCESCFSSTQKDE